METDPFPPDSENKDDNWSPEDWGQPPKVINEVGDAEATTAEAKTNEVVANKSLLQNAILNQLYWLCKVCNVSNQGAKCRACLTPRYNSPYVLWRCGVCKVLNEKERATCKACGSRANLPPMVKGWTNVPSVVSNKHSNVAPASSSPAIPSDFANQVNKVFTIEGKRMRLERKDAKTLVERLEKEGQHNRYRKIRLSTRSLTIPAAEVFADHIQRMTNLREADLSDIISGIETEEAYEVYRILNRALGCLGNLRHLDLSDNALGPKIDAFPDIITWRLHSIKVNNTGLSAAACRILTDLILKSMEADGKDSCDLRVVEHFNSCSDFEGAMHISRLLGKCPLLEDFRMESIRAHEAVRTVIQILGRHCPGLQRMRIADNNFKINSKEKLDELTAAISQFSDLRNLTLSDCPFEFAGALATVGDALGQYCPALTCINLNMSLEQDTEGLTALFDGISSCRALNELHLEGCEMEDTGSECLVRFIMANKPKLCHLNVKTNQISSVAAIALVRALIVTGATASLETHGLELDENEISATGLERIRSLLEGVGHLHVLDTVDTNGIEDEDLPYEQPVHAPKTTQEGTPSPAQTPTQSKSASRDFDEHKDREPDSERAPEQALQLNATDDAPDAEAALFTAMCNQCNTDGDDDDDEDYSPEEESPEEDSYEEEYDDDDQLEAKLAQEESESKEDSRGAAFATSTKIAPTGLFGLF